MPVNNFELEVEYGDHGEHGKSSYDEGSKSGALYSEGRNRSESEDEDGVEYGISDGGGDHDDGGPSGGACCADESISDHGNDEHGHAEVPDEHILGDEREDFAFCAEEGEEGVDGEDSDDDAEEGEHGGEDEDVEDEALAVE